MNLTDGKKRIFDWAVNHHKEDDVFPIAVEDLTTYYTGASDENVFREYIQYTNVAELESLLRQIIGDHGGISKICAVEAFRLRKENATLRADITSMDISLPDFVYAM